MSKGLDTNGDSLYTGADKGMFYGDTMNITIKRDDGLAIPEDAEFIFTFDG